MIRFNNDYNHGAHPKILEALTVINNDSFGGYGEDEWCKKAADLIRKKVNCPDAGELYCDRQRTLFCTECNRCGYRAY